MTDEKEENIIQRFEPPYNDICRCRSLGFHVSSFNLKISRCEDGRLRLVLGRKDEVFQCLKEVLLLNIRIRNGKRK